MVFNRGSLTVLRQAYKLAKIRPIDYYFAAFINKQQANDDVAIAAALVSLNNATGSVCLDLARLADSVLFRDENFEGVKTPVLKDWLLSLKNHEWVAEKQFPSALVLDNTKLYLGKYWFFEQQLATNILARIRQQILVDKPQLVQGLERYFPATKLPVDWQKIAASVAVQNGFSVISGGPGTGKTSTVLKVLALLLEQNNNLNIALCAPTGKAAARLTESIKKGLHVLPVDIRQLIPSEAKTIHRLLKINLKEGEFKHNASNPVMVDVLLVDEVSMVDLVLMSKLMDAIPLTTKVILLGDKDQLSSVEAGCILADITGRHDEITHTDGFINCKHSGSYSPEEPKYLHPCRQGVDDLAPFSQPSSSVNTIQNVVVQLKHSYRFGVGSGIGQLAKLVNNKKGHQALTEVLHNKQHSDCTWLDIKKDAEQTQVIDVAVEQYKHYIKQQNIETALLMFDHFRVLCAVRTGNCGVELLNLQIKNQLVKQQLIDNNDYYASMPIMITQNDYESGLFNGDTGLLWKDEAGLLAAYFPEQDGLKKVALSRLPEFELAYALTVHKSQGSEFDNVLLCLPSYVSDNISKELIYTGITRAKSQVIIAAEPQSFVRSCSNSVSRESGLSKLLGWQ